MSITRGKSDNQADYLTLMLCNDVVTDREGQRLMYIGASPDEVTLVDVCKGQKVDALDMPMAYPRFLLPPSTAKQMVSSSSTVTPTPSKSVSTPLSFPPLNSPPSVVCPSSSVIPSTTPFVYI